MAKVNLLGNFYTHFYSSFFKNWLLKYSRQLGCYELLAILIIDHELAVPWLCQFCTQSLPALSQLCDRGQPADQKTGRLWARDCDFVNCGLPVDKRAWSGIQDGGRWRVFFHRWQCFGWTSLCFQWFTVIRVIWCSFYDSFKGQTVVQVKQPCLWFGMSCSFFLHFFDKKGKKQVVCGASFYLPRTLVLLQHKIYKSFEYLNKSFSSEIK